MVIKPIPTLRKVIIVGGRVFWSDSRQRIDLKKPVRDLLEKNNQVGYVMEICMCKARVFERARELMQDGVMPILLYFTKEEHSKNLLGGSLLEEEMEQ
ncbi:hypothetical protein KY343_02580 [Candidatus Woesearchaeota archaeon]|nr:hypothetical protein [Candidatus Woesearchaeota archaeon]